MMIHIASAVVGPRHAGLILQATEASLAQFGGKDATAVIPSSQSGMAPRHLFFPSSRCCFACGLLRISSPAQGRGDR